MRFGPNLVYCCMACKGLFCCRSILSGNTFGANFRSDGKIDAPMLHNTPPLVACPHCGAAFEMHDAQSVGQHTTDPTTINVLQLYLSKMLKSSTRNGEPKPDVLRNFRVCTGYLEATLDQCLTWAELKNLSGTKTVWPMLYAWHRINDDRESTKYRRPFTNREIGVITKILKSLPRTRNATLLRAEGWRELGHFQRSRALLKRQFEAKEANIARQLLDAVERKETAPFIFASPECP